MPYLIIDIETVADGELIKKIKFQDSSEEEKKIIETSSSREIVQKYQEQLLKESNSGKFFIPHTLQIPISIAVILVRDDFTIASMTTLDRGHFRPHLMVEQFWKGWENKIKPATNHYEKDEYPTIVTFNGRGFDLPVLELSAFRYGISIPKWFQTNEMQYKQPRYRFKFDYHFDLMEFLTNFGSTRFDGGLFLTSVLLGSPGKMDIKGSMVQELWDNGEKEKIDDYCLCDTLDTYFTFLRVNLLIGHINLEREQEIIQLAKEMIKENSNKYPILVKYLHHFQPWKSPNK